MILATMLIALALVGAAGAVGDDDDDDRGDCHGTRCYAAFSEPADFRTARAKCSQLGGHLAAVRSADLKSLLRRVLERRAPGPYWVGLHRPAGCLDRASPLRGFRWETPGDRSSDFHDWVDPAADSAGCARQQCVSVSSEDGFKWSAGACDGRSAGFLCESSRADACAPDGGVSGHYSRAPPHVGGRSSARLPHGTVASRDPDGHASICLSGEWVHAPWSCGIREGGCEFKCMQDPRGPPRCLCPPGHELSSGNPVACQPVQSDTSCRDLGCEHSCAGTAAAPPACTCRPGFELGADGRSCRHADGGSACGAGGPCPAPPPRSLALCARGFRPNLVQDCVDLDECQQVPCEHQCVNTPGSFACSCFDGYRVDPADPVKCKLHCGQASCPAECDPNDPDDCMCPDGYILDDVLDDHFCVDINECTMFSCDQRCSNSFGGYTCGCEAGFALEDNGRCVPAASTTAAVTYVSAPAATTTSSTVPHRPARLSAGGLVSVVASVAVAVILAAFLVHHLANRRKARRRALSHWTFERGEEDGEPARVEQKETQTAAP